MRLPEFLQIGLVTNGEHVPSKTDGYLTYQLNGEEGEINITGPAADEVARHLAAIWKR